MDFNLAVVGRQTTKFNSLPNFPAIRYNVMVSFVSANVSAEDFFNGNTSAIEQRAGDLAVTFFLEQNTATVLTDSGFGQSPAVIIAPTVVVFLLLLLVAAVFVTIGTFIACRHRSKRYT